MIGFTAHISGGELSVFESCTGYLAEKMAYSRELDEASEPTDQIKDKHNFHFMDAERYIGGYLYKKNPSQKSKAKRIPYNNMFGGRV